MPVSQHEKKFRSLLTTKIRRTRASRLFLILLPSVQYYKLREGMWEIMIVKKCMLFTRV